MKLIGTGDTMTTHGEWLNEVLSDDQYNKEYEVATIEDPLHPGKRLARPDGYREDFDYIAYEIMQEEDCSITGLCVTLQVSKMTVLSWMKRHVSFRNAVENGRLIGEKKFRDKLYVQAFKPANEVNTALIKMMAKNIHDISDDKGPLVVIQNNQNQEQNMSTDESANLYAEAIGRVEQDQ